eukprot:snap_masked-scaffold_8-processed-gene-6.26-mRNA-1 protein AED:1.00 eAED:1.00 QI:0/-1/0/0/-1/1/1/0/263
MIFILFFLLGGTFVTFKRKDIFSREIKKCWFIHFPRFFTEICSPLRWLPVLLVSIQKYMASKTKSDHIIRERLHEPKDFEELKESILSQLDSSGNLNVNHDIKLPSNVDNETMFQLFDSLETLNMKKIKKFSKNGELNFRGYKVLLNNYLENSLSQTIPSFLNTKLNFGVNWGKYMDLKRNYVEPVVISFRERVFLNVFFSGAASLREAEYRGKTSLAMCYKTSPLVDHFVQLSNENTLVLLGTMTANNAFAGFFVLEQIHSV